ncbi:hypothetical protein DERF_012504 [Dermatophagoides farinae]|uniref:Uncharacterized protein n=1 Tax=Dermatophagoides farinae TaxID=6954 RepID=A0A922HPP7_DERFA|nr:hypothetical protein DERF_012504 [Dermatophagoides farinae]
MHSTYTENKVGDFLSQIIIIIHNLLYHLNKDGYFSNQRMNLRYGLLFHHLLIHYGFYYHE